MAIDVLVPSQNLHVPTARPRVEWVVEVDDRVASGLAVTICQDDDGRLTDAHVRRIRTPPCLKIVQSR